MRYNERGLFISYKGHSQHVQMRGFSGACLFKASMHPVMVCFIEMADATRTRIRLFSTEMSFKFLEHIFTLFLRHLACGNDTGEDIQK